jgi:hypothetical protein
MTQYILKVRAVSNEYYICVSYRGFNNENIMLTISTNINTYIYFILYCWTQQCVNPLISFHNVGIKYLYGFLSLYIFPLCGNGWQNILFHSTEGVKYLVNIYKPPACYTVQVGSFSFSAES